MKFVDLDAQYAIIEQDIRAAIDRVLEHKQFILGPEVADLENKLSDYCGAKHVIATASGTDALLIALMAYEIGPGDAVIAPPFTFVATAEVIHLLGATAVFVDVDETTFNLDVSKLEETIARVKAETSLQLKGIIPVDLFGSSADYDAIQPIAEQHGLFVLSDAAQSFGGEYKNQKVGRFGNITATSFFPAKPLGCYGDGGALFTDDSNLANILESIRFHGKGVSQYENIRIGVTGRLDTLQAAVLSCKLAIFDQELKRRQDIADYYNSELSDHVNTPQIPERNKSAWAVYTIRSAKRDKIKEKLQEGGIPFAVYYPVPLHRQPAFANAFGGGKDMPVSDRLAEQVISLPIHPYLHRDDQKKIVQAIKSAI